jgi:hypothetical protein
VKGPEVDQGGLEKASPFSLPDQWFESISLQPSSGESANHRFLSGGHSPIKPVFEEAPGIRSRASAECGTSPGGRRQARRSDRFLEELHTLKASAVDRVANDLRKEIAVVTVEPGISVSPAEPGGKSDTVSQVALRLTVLEESVHRQGRVIKRVIEIAASYFQGDRP